MLYALSMLHGHPNVRTLDTNDYPLMDYEVAVKCNTFVAATLRASWLADRGALQDAPTREAQEAAQRLPDTVTASPPFRPVAAPTQPANGAAREASSDPNQTLGAAALDNLRAAAMPYEARVIDRKQRMAIASFVGDCMGYQGFPRDGLLGIMEAIL